MAKAYLEFLEWSGSRGSIAGKIEFQFNPQQFAIEKSAEWVETSTGVSGTSPPPHYIGPKAGTMQLEMFLDASEKKNGDVSKDVKRLLDACLPTPSSESKKRPLPPKVRFGWDKIHFEGYVHSVSANYTLFRMDGRPIRATCTVSLREVPRAVPRQNPTSGTPVPHRTTQSVAGDSLAAIAYREYGDPTRWRVIAEANDIDDPLRLKPGTPLLLPMVDANA